MGTVEISMDEYKVLIESNVRLNQVVTLLVNTKTERDYIDRDRLELIVGTLEPLKQSKDGKAEPF